MSRPDQPEAEVPQVVPALVTEIVPIARPLPPERQPALLYLAGLAPSGRRTMRGALANVSHPSGGERDLSAARSDSILVLLWHQLRYSQPIVLALVSGGGAQSRGERQSRAIPGPGPLASILSACAPVRRLE